MRATADLSQDSFSDTVGYAPLMDRRRFAQAVGVTAETVEGWIARRELPMVKIGRRNLVNVAAIHRRCLLEEA